MSTVVFFTLIFSASLQASWNFFAKKSSAHKTTLIVTGWMLFGLVSMPLVMLFTDMSSINLTSLKLVLLSSAIHCLYVFLLGWGYTIADISIVFPISRGFAILVTSVVMSLVTSQELSNRGILGIALITLGTFILGLSQYNKSKSLRGVQVALFVGLSVATYYMIDSFSMQSIPNLFFVAATNFVGPFFALPFLLTKYKKQTLEVIRFRKKEAFMVAFTGAASYCLVLWAFTQSTTAYVVALREVSIVIAAALGIIFLKESLNWKKALGIALILLGVVALRLI